MDKDLLDEEILDYEDENEVERFRTNTLEKEMENLSESMREDEIHTSGFRDFLLKPELLKAISDCGFEHPSEVQQQVLPQAMLGGDILCQAKSGMGKTAVFVLGTLQMLDLSDDNEDVKVLVLCHTRELAFQIAKEYERFSKYLAKVKVQVCFGGLSIQTDIAKLTIDKPKIIVGTPGRILQLLRQRKFDPNNLRHFVLDECDKMLEALEMRDDIQKIFMKTPRTKQVMMFSATLSKDIRPVCKKFMKNPIELYVDDEAELALKSVVQHYIQMEEHEKTEKLYHFLNILEFNQVIIFVRTVERCISLAQHMFDTGYTSVVELHGRMPQRDRLARFHQFKTFQKRMLVATNLCGRGIDVEKVNIIINYDMAEDAPTYLHRVARAGRFGGKGMAITFVSSEDDTKILNDVQRRYNIEVTVMPTELDFSKYMGKR